jgi:hypothetical protein
MQNFPKRLLFLLSVLILFLHFAQLNCGNSERVLPDQSKPSISARTWISDSGMISLGARLASP